MEKKYWKLGLMSWSRYSQTMIPRMVLEMTSSQMKVMYMVKRLRLLSVDFVWRTAFPQLKIVTPKDNPQIIEAKFISFSEGGCSTKCSGTRKPRSGAIFGRVG